jgi:hypothetical protein
MRYREALADVMRQIVLEKKRPTDEEIRVLAERNVESRDLSSFVKLVMQEFQRLNEFNIARYRLRLSEYWAWYRALHSANPES